MSHRFRHHAATTSLDVREAEIAAAWHVGRLSLLWAVAILLAALFGPPSPAPESLTAQPDASSIPASMSWGA